MGVESWTFDSAKATITKYRFAPDARFPVHHHAEEQIILVDQGSIEVIVGDEKSTMGAGDFLVIEPHIQHGVTAGTDGAQFVAVIVPRREHKDAYVVVDSDVQQRSPTPPAA